jgi:DNA replicative helicase MCM subunit Mcm2 (Cdc46/Mcm family)
MLNYVSSQLEAIIRITESLAKMTLSPVATEAHVDEAIRLFRQSTMDAVQSGQGTLAKAFFTKQRKIIVTIIIIIKIILIIILIIIMTIQ